MNEYPSEDVLQIIREWPPERFGELMALVESAWSEYGRFERDGRKYTLITGGWSGNEDLIWALQKNLSLFWTLCWQESKRGGHHVFEIPEFIL